METLSVYLIKANVLLLVFYLLYRFLLAKDTFYNNARWFLLFGLISAVVLPLVTFTKVVYVSAKPMLHQFENEIINFQNLPKNVEEPIISIENLLLGLYFIVFGVLLLKTISDFVKLFKIIFLSKAIKKNKLIYINTNLVKTPFSFFKYIVYNAELINQAELENILKHEEAHSLQKHSFDTLLAQFFVLVFWYNPVIWLYRKSLVQNLEFIADKQAINQVANKQMYQKTMLKITIQNQGITIINHFNQSLIKKRIVMLNTNQTSRKKAWKMTLIFPILIAFMLLFQVETVAKVKPFKEEEKSWIEGIKDAYNEGYRLGSAKNADQMYIINKNLSNTELDYLIKSFKETYQLEAKYYDVKRNKNNEIIAIKLKIKKNNKISLIHEVSGDEAIDEFGISINNKNGKTEVEIINDIAYGIDATNNKKTTVIKNGNWKEIDSILKSGTNKVYVPKTPSIPSVPINYVEKQKENLKTVSETNIVKSTINVETSINETLPEPPGGIAKFRQYVGQKFRLPEVKQKVIATVIAKFVVSETGEIENIEIIRENPTNLGLGNEFIRVLKASEKWKPGTKDGKPLKVYYTLPLQIEITEAK